MQRRTMLGSMLTAPAGVVERRPGKRVKLALNAYSFNKPLLAGQMKLEDVIDFCADNELDGVDLTGYYFAGYPQVPSDAAIYAVKRRAWMNGVSIGGTGVRNDFALADAAARAEQVRLVKAWVDVCVKLGGNMVRVFSGREVPAGRTFAQVRQAMVPAFQDCAAYAAERGVLLGLQHHHDYLKTAAETMELVEAVGSPWFTVILDVGSLRSGDPYQEIERLLPYASNWQVKEHVWYGERKVEIDLVRLRQIIEKVGYRGFLPVEALAVGDGDARLAVKAFLNRVRKAFA